MALRFDSEADTSVIPMVQRVASSGMEAAASSGVQNVAQRAVLDMGLDHLLSNLRRNRKVTHGAAVGLTPARLRY